MRVLDVSGKSEWTEAVCGDSQTWLHVRVTLGALKTPHVHMRQLTQKSPELILKALQVITLCFENLEGGKPLRGRREVRGGWEWELSKD